jgi:RNA polymerase sigma-70 factor (ECF subfamily)
MADLIDAEPSGQFEARYLAFLETIAHLRPSLHRYCARMTGSVLDGEDIVQEALFQAYRKLDRFDDSRPMSPWLFRIAHNRCIDFLRRRGVRIEAETAVMEPDIVAPADPPSLNLGRAVEHLVVTLPPKERACVLLKDVFDYTLEEIAALVDSTVGGVKAALNRGRAKLAPLRERPVPSTVTSVESSQILGLYVDRFNRRDWDGLRELISADARLQVADRFLGPIGDSSYFGRYERLGGTVQLALGQVDDDIAVIVLRERGGTWSPESPLRITVANGRITRIADYTHCSWVLSAAGSVVVGDSHSASVT